MAIDALANEVPHEETTDTFSMQLRLPRRRSVYFALRQSNLVELPAQSTQPERIVAPPLEHLGHSNHWHPPRITHPADLSEWLGPGGVLPAHLSVEDTAD